MSRGTMTAPKKKVISFEIETTATNAELKRWAGEALEAGTADVLPSGRRVAVTGRPKVETVQPVKRG